MACMTLTEGPWVILLRWLDWIPRSLGRSSGEPRSRCQSDSAERCPGVLLTSRSSLERRSAYIGEFYELRKNRYPAIMLEGIRRLEAVLECSTA